MTWKDRMLMILMPWRKPTAIVPPGRNTGEALADVRRRQADIERRLAMLAHEVDVQRRSGGQ